MDKTEGWDYINNAIETTHRFKDFRDAFATMTRIAFECEVQGHHPEWTNVYDRLRIRLNTHDVGGITEKDFRLAHAIDRILGRE